MDVEQAITTFQESPVPHKDFGFLVVPKRLRYSAHHPLYFGLWSRLVFGSASALTVANLYYCQPLLSMLPIRLSIHSTQSYYFPQYRCRLISKCHTRRFHSEPFYCMYDCFRLIFFRVPTMYQVGYCIGLFFISPLGDLLRRRQLILALVFITTCLSVGLALSKSLLVFRTFAFLIGVFNVTPQILVPFAADLASPGQHGAAVSTLQAGIMVGILLARVFAGVVAYFFSWRLVYYISIGIQVLVLCGTYLLIPDQPCRNPNLTYYEIFYTMAKYLVEPRLMQVMLVNVASIACWSSFWVTLTFLLGSPPYQYSTLYIGLFGLIGVVGVLGGPLFGRFIDRFGPWLSLLVATCCLLALQGIETAAAGINIAVVVSLLHRTQCFPAIPDGFFADHSLWESSRKPLGSRLNAILTLSLSAGQALGTSAGSKVFLTYGWRAASALSMAFYGWQLLVLLLRGPNCKQSTWFGYEGGFMHQVEQKQTGSATPATQTSSMVERENIQTLQT
ncbi:major facilitator superfamily domain-containing protein [Boletus edulis]|nr:major facilitator superfamily domain-containing protein [Boletus edulis]